MSARKSEKLGTRRGMLTVIGFDVLHHKRFICKCDCGNIVAIHKCNINSNRSCGCLIGRTPAHLYEWSDTLETWIPKLD